MATAQALAFLDFFGQLSTKCPVPPQNMQKLFLSRHLCSSAVSFPSLPSLLVKSSLEPDEDWLLVTLDEPEVFVELGELPLELEGLVGQGRLALRRMRDFVFVLPIVCVDLLTKGSQPIQSQGIPDSCNLILKVVQEPGVE